MWVIFEGLDKSGKGTLEREFLKATNFKHIVIDRGPAGYAAFDKIFDRTTINGVIEFAANAELMRQARNEFLVVYCKAPKDVAMQRIAEHNETCPYDYEWAQKFYDCAVKIFYEDNGVHVVTVDTTKSIDECIKIIIKKLEEVQKGEL